MISINKLPQPVIAMVQGIATAAGCQLVASCDLAVASEVSQLSNNISTFARLHQRIIPYETIVPRMQSLACRE
jgi:hypothetical protein